MVHKRSPAKRAERAAHIPTRSQGHLDLTPHNAGHLINNQADRVIFSGGAHRSDEELEKKERWDYEK